MNMHSKRSGLGRNLSSLLSQSDILAPQSDSPQVVTVGVDKLRPGRYQPRLDMDEANLKDLAASIKQQGILQPLVIRDVGGDYEIIAGERRWRAARLAGLTEVPATVHQADDETAMVIALVENLQREDLTAMDQARAMARLVNECELTHQQVAKMLSKSRAAVSNFIRLLQLHEDVQALIEAGALEMGHARALLSLSLAEQPKIAAKVIALQLSVRETEALVAKSKDTPSQARKSSSSLPKQYEKPLQSISNCLQTKVQVKPSKAGGGSLVISYDNDQGLERLLDKLNDLA